MQRSPGSSVNVVIPVWNDEEALAQSLPPLLLEWSANRIWVVDGGSTDGSTDVARRHGVHLLKVDVASRSFQMNAGTDACGGEIILFLHADTHLPRGAPGLIERAIADGAIGGAFARRFDHASRFLRMTSRSADWRGQIFGTFFGDQAIFSTHSAFQKLGGFPDQPLFEDFEFTRRLSRLGRTTLLKPPVISSARRFRKNGVIRQTLADFSLTIHYAVRGPACLPHSALNQKIEKSNDL